MTWKFFDRRGSLIDKDPAPSYPVGVMLPFLTVSGPVPTVPSGWRLCDGASVSSSLYPELGEVLTGSTAHPYNFNLPNMGAAFPTGGVTAGAVNTADLSIQRSRHNHGGSSSSHGHVNQHRHAFPAHTHNVPHYHNHPTTGHVHGAGTLILASPPATGPITTASNNGAADVSKGYGSGDRHYHDVGGTTGEPNVARALNYTNDATTGGGNTAASLSSAISLTSKVIPVNAAISDILPPYLNVYFIIKAGI